MPDRQQCEFYLLRYVPDAVKDEFVNLGVVLVDSSHTSGFADVRFTHDWKHVRCLDPDADVEVLAALENEIRKHLSVSGDERAELIRQITETFSTGVQATDAHYCLTESPADELDTLAKMYLEPKPGAPPEEKRTSGRNFIVGEMRSAFESAGVWGLMRKRIPVAAYSFAADPLKIDCGYLYANGNGAPRRGPVLPATGQNGVVRMFHAIGFDSNASESKALAFSYPHLAEGLMREERAKAELTAVVAPDYDAADEAVRFSLNVLKRSEIQIATLTDLPRLAQRAKEELKA
jgi:hypothetical protein